MLLMPELEYELHVQIAVAACMYGAAVLQQAYARHTLTASTMFLL